ncbi:6,7-dimethyl-8-ribityllumazine synthase [Albirhodobacter sp. R86504]|uniref:6,7-dimethyl-8-ribityllumazine synthase n=1 Tax=Albirhodobacter sp. R86504 TaxID=3093848 RepID=UPI003672EC0B
MTQSQGYILPPPDLPSGLKLLAVVAPYHKAITDLLLQGAQSVADQSGAHLERIEVPSAQDIPAAIRFAARMADFDGFIALGCLVRGDTLSFDLIARESASALAMMGVEGLCIGNGILALEGIAQAEARACPPQNDGGDTLSLTIDCNKGAAAAHSALHLIALSRKWARQTKGIGFRPSGESFRIAGEPEGENRA